ncbi:hypothetical protein, partial [Streptomyces sp. NPDC093089]|uniref:hypothetical protein n=1 Tax=Streptomyces sp. NPDC093089 TaxID=3366024 RepID=UPI0037F7C0A7
FYNSNTRAAGSGQLDASGDYAHLKSFPAGQFGTWGEIVSPGSGQLFFYNSNGGSAVAGSGRLDATGNYVNLKDFPAGQFGQWTSVVG